MKAIQIRKDISPSGDFLPMIMPSGKTSSLVYDKMYASILLLKFEEGDLLWIVLDAVKVDEDFSSQIRTNLSKKHRIPFENINIAYTHSHCAPRITFDMNAKHPDACGSVNYIDDVAKKICNGADECFNSEAKEVDVFLKTVDAKDFYGNRIDSRMPSDTMINLIEMKDDSNNSVASLLCFACHSTVIDFKKSDGFSSDLAGYLARGIEEKCGSYPLVILGAAGNMSNRCCRQGDDYQELIRIGDGILGLFDSSQEQHKLILDLKEIRRYSFLKEIVIDKESKEKQISRICDYMKKLHDEKMINTCHSSIDKIKDRKEEKKKLLIEGTLFDLGDMMICTIPAELFCELGIKIKEKMNKKLSTVWCYSNYSIGYLYTKESCGKSIESLASEIPYGVSEEVTDLCISMIVEEQLRIKSCIS